MLNKRTLSDPGTKITTLILTCFFLSGITGLMYEVLWTRLIVKIIGGAPFAVSIILTIFMAGLGLGSFIASRTIDKIKNPGKLVSIYGILEIIIGLYALVIPSLLTVFRPVYAVMYNQLFSHFMLFNILTFVGCSFLLCLPVICMGATLPILCRFYVTRLSHLATHAGRLYGLNTIGAALGALLCGFWFINIFGVVGTLIFAVSINCIIGVVCLLASFTFAKSNNLETQPVFEASPQPPSTKTFHDQYPVSLSGTLLIFAISGFCSMAYEVIWSKLLGLIVGPTTYSFTIVLVTFITGLALGSMFFGWIADKIKKPIWLLFFTQVAAALFALGISQLLGNSQFFFTKMIFHLREHFAMLSFMKTLALFILLILPTLCLGATFPLVGKIYTRSVSKVGKSIGSAYAINTVGAVLGSFCAGFVLIPLIGKEKGISFVVCIQILVTVIIASFILFQSKRGLLKYVFLVILSLLGIFLCLHFPRWNRHLLANGKYHRFNEIKVDIESCGWLNAFVNGPEILAESDETELVYYGEGVGGFTTVLKYEDMLGHAYYSMVNSGKADASSRYDMNTQLLLAHFPMLFHPNPKAVMVLGLASGITAGEILYYPINLLDVIDINSQVVEASDFFLPWNNNVLANPKTNLIIQDGRAHLQLTDQKYDVIISEPSNPWMAGLATLFTRDFFELSKNKLNQDGIFIQWFHSYQMDWNAFALVGRTFAKTFPNNMLIFTQPSSVFHDYLLVGFKGNKKLNPQYAEDKLVYAQKSKNFTLSDPKLLYRFFASEDLQGLFGEGPVNTDNWPRLEFAAPKLMYHSDVSITKNIQSNLLFSDESKNIIQNLLTDVDAQIDFAAYVLSVYAPFRGMVDLAQTTPVQKERFFKLVESYCARDSVDFSIFNDSKLVQRCLSIQIEIIQNKINQISNKAKAYFNLATLYLKKGMLDQAVDNYYKSLQLQPDNPVVHNDLAIVLARQGKFDSAIVHLQEALQLKPDFTVAKKKLAHIKSFKARLEAASKSKNTSP